MKLTLRDCLECENSIEHKNGYTCIGEWTTTYHNMKMKDQLDKEFFMISCKKAPGTYTVGTYVINK